MIRNLMTILFGVMLCCPAAPTCAAPSDEQLGLHPDGKPWQFHGDQGRADGLPRVLLIGDSILSGYHVQVTTALKGKASVDTWVTPMHLASGSLHKQLRDVLSRGPYDVIHFNIGLHGWPPGRIPEGKYEQLMRQYVDILLHHSPKARLVWAATTQITVKGKPTELDPVHNATIVERNAIAARVMGECGIPINDLYTLMAKRLNLAKGDGFHWTAPGRNIHAKAVIDAVKQALARPGQEQPVTGNTGS